MEHFLDRSEVIDRWNRDHPFRLTVSSGDTVHLEMHDASGGQVYPGMSAEAFDKIDKLRIHSLTGPIEVAGAEPGDRLMVEVLEYAHEGWAWTSIIPGMGLLPEDFPDPFIHTWKLEGNVTHSMPGLAIPLVPFCGVIGVQLQEHGTFRTRPPGVNGGNMDVRHLCAGSVLHLPVATPGAGLCAGDCHAAQGDGEVSINGMEAPMTVKLKITLVKNSPISGPYIHCPSRLDPEVIAAGAHHLFIESAEDIRSATKQVVRRAIAYLCKRLGLSKAEAYVVCSVALRLKLSQVVNHPVTTVSGYLPEGIFTEPSPDCLP